MAKIENNFCKVWVLYILVEQMIVFSAGVCYKKNWQRKQQKKNISKKFDFSMFLFNKWLFILLKFVGKSTERKIKKSNFSKNFILVCSRSTPWMFVLPAMKGSLLVEGGRDLVFALQLSDKVICIQAQSRHLCVCVSQ